MVSWGGWKWGRGKWRQNGNNRTKNGGSLVQNEENWPKNGGNGAKMGEMGTKMGGECVCPLPGCEVESIFLNIDAVNTHRERPQAKTPLPSPPQYTAHLPPAAGGWDNLGPPPTPPPPFTPQNVDVTRPPNEALVTVPEHY